MRISNPKSYKGVFWRPDLPDKKVAGVLSVEDGGHVGLDLHSNFDATPQELLTSTSLPRIVGVIEGNKYVTLENCIYEGKNMGLTPLLALSKIFVHVAYIGISFDHEEAALWDEVSFSVEGLNEWCNKSGISVNFKESHSVFDVHYSRPKAILLWENEQAKLEIAFSSQPPGFPAITEATIRQSALFRYSTKQPKPLDELIGVAHQLVLFMCFATDKIVSICDVKVASERHKEGIPGKAQYKARFDVYYSSIFHDENPPKVRLHDCVFRFAEIENKSQQLFENWFKTYDVILPAISLYFSACGKTYKFLNGRFLAVAQALETYHRHFASEALQTMPDTEFEALKTALVSAAPPDRQEWVNSKIKYLNQPILGKRLEHLFGLFGELFGDAKAIKVLVRKITDTRNYNTHFSDELKDKSAEGVQLWNLCQKMELLFQLYLLKELGFQVSDILNMARDNDTLSRKLKSL